MLERLTDVALRLFEDFESGSPADAEVVDALETIIVRLEGANLELDSRFPLAKPIDEVDLALFE